MPKLRTSPWRRDSTKPASGKPGAVQNLGSKSQLLNRLTPRLLGYRDRIRKGENLRLLVLVDRDDDECERLKERLELAARDGIEALLA